MRLLIFREMLLQENRFQPNQVVGVLNRMIVWSLVL